MRTARWLLLTVTAGVLALFLAPALVAATAGANTGFLEVCKASDGSGVAGTFRFTVGAQTIAVPVGACSAPLELPVGPLTVTEEAVAGVGVTSIDVVPAERQLSVSLPGRSVQVNVVAGGIADQTLVTFTNRSELGILTICKVAGAGIATGTNFTFTVGGRAIAVPAGQCIGAGSFPYNSLVTITEALEPTVRVSDISVIPPNRMVGAPSLVDGAVTVTIGMLATQVTFTNESVPLGSLQICKESSTTSLTGNFTFTAAGHRVDVPVGGCSGVLRVPEGVVAVSEVQRPDTRVSAVDTVPAARLVQTDLPGGTAHVQVVGGSLLQLTTVTFTNALQTSQVKICKVAGSGVTLGTPFSFIVAGVPHTVPAGSCALAGSFPVGIRVMVTEAVPTGMQVADIRVLPAERLSGTPSLATASVAIVTGPGVTEVMVTNQTVSLPTLPTTTTTTLPSIAVPTTLPVTTLPTVPLSTTSTMAAAPTTTTLSMSTTSTIAPTTSTSLSPTSTTAPAPTTTTTAVPLGATSTTLPLTTTSTLQGNQFTTTTAPATTTTTTAVPLGATSTTLPLTTTSTLRDNQSTFTTTPASTTSTTAAPLVSTDNTTVANSTTTTTVVPCVDTTTVAPSSTSTTAPLSSAPTTIPTGQVPATATTVAPESTEMTEPCAVTSSVSTPTTIVGMFVGQLTAPVANLRLAMTGSEMSLLFAAALACLGVGALILLAPRGLMGGRSLHRSRSVWPRGQRGGRGVGALSRASRSRVRRHRARDVWRH